LGVKKREEVEPGMIAQHIVFSCKSNVSQRDRKIVTFANNIFTGWCNRFLATWRERACLGETVDGWIGMVG
jgi:hypothetical protein